MKKKIISVVLAAMLVGCGAAGDNDQEASFTSASDLMSDDTAQNGDTEITDDATDSANADDSNTDSLTEDEMATEITIPESVTKIGDKAFGGRGAVLDTKKGESVDWISYITAYHMKSATPPTLEGVLYEADKVSSTPTIYVPTGSLEAYKAADGWSSLNIEEE